LTRAARLLEAAAADLEVTDGRIAVRGMPARLSLQNAFPTLNRSM
jgi:hypothetical protein